MNRDTLIFILLIVLAMIAINGCNTNTPEKVVADAPTYTPGLGEFMMQLEYHHTKLGEAITEKNFERIAYETEEMEEIKTLIVQYHNKHEKLSSAFEMQYNAFITPILTEISTNNNSKNETLLKQNFISLTANCNGCHTANKVAFIKVEQ